MTRKPIPDIMSGLMSGNTAILEEPANNKEIIQENNTAIKPASNKTTRTTSNKAVEINEEPKEKATFNLSVRVLEDLEDSWIQLKRQLKGEQRITKTQMVEKALELALKDLKAKGEKSEFFKQLN